MFRFTYGFTCTCPSCTNLKRFDASWPVPDGEVSDSIWDSLRNFMFPNKLPSEIRLPSSPVNLETIPLDILPVFRESCLTSLCESFSTFSHDGPFESAIEVGLTILAFYVAIYPPNYPQIGVFFPRDPDCLETNQCFRLTRVALVGNGQDSMECLHYNGSRRSCDTA